METRINDLQINNLSRQLDKLGNVIDKVCDRVIKLEEDYQERLWRARVIKFLFYIYPAIMLVLVCINTSDHQKIINLIDKSKDLMTIISSFRD